MTKPAKTIEEQLFDENTPQPTSNLNDLEKAFLYTRPGGQDIFFDENGHLDAHAPVTTLVEGEAALKLFGLDPRRRPHCELQREDYPLMYRKLKPLIVDLQSRGASVKDHVWKHILIRVWNQKNIGQQTGSGTNSSDIAVGKYVGDVFDGEAIEGFFSPVPTSTKYKDFRIQLLSVNLTEELASVLSI